MASAIDPTIPVTGNPTTASQRSNWVTLSSEITALQAAVAALQAGGGSGSTATLIQSFSLTNWSTTATSPGFHRGGVPFVKGQVPAGTSVQIKRGSTVIDAQFDERATWTDGSLKFAVMHLRDTTFTVSEVRTYDVWTVPSTAFVNTGTKVLSDITATHDFKVAFTSLTETDDTPVTVGVGSGAFTASFNTHSAVATRREKHHVGLVAEGWTLWGMATDNTGGAPDAHLKTNWHVDIWKNQDGSIYAYEVGAVVTQDWWSVANKRRRNYNAALKDGATTIQSYAAVLHPYHQQWITCQNVSGDFSRGKRHWVGGAQPTLLYKPSKSYWVSSGVVPPLDTTFQPNAYGSGGNDVYVPCNGTQNHRGSLNDGGGYEGRGVLSVPDTVAFMRQTAYDTAAARINGHVLLHFPCHFRSNRTRTRPGDGAADTANTQISLIMRIEKDNAGTQVAVAPYDFTADGMPIPVHAYMDYRSDPAYQDGFVTGGGNGSAWYRSADGTASHEPSIGYFIYALEGERYHLEANLDEAFNQVHVGISNQFGNRPLNGLLSNFAAYNNARPAGEQAQLILGPFDAMGGVVGAERSWGANLIGHGAGLVPDNHVAANCVKRLNRQQSYITDAMLYAAPPDVLAGGAHPTMDGSTAAKHWMSTFNLLSAYHNYSITEEAGMKRWAAHFAMQTIGLVESGPRKSTEYVGLRKGATAWWDATTNPYLPRGEQSFIHDEPGKAFQLAPITVASSTRHTGITPWPPLVGDKWYHKTRDEDSMTNDSPVAHAVPAGSTDGQPFYVKTVTAVGDGTYNLQFSLTPGGATFNWTDLNVQLDASMSGPSCDAWTSGEGISGDTYASIQRAAMVEAYRQGHPNASSALVAKMQSYLNATNDAGNPVWKYA